MRTFPVFTAPRIARLSMRTPGTVARYFTTSRFLSSNDRDAKSLGVVNVPRLDIRLDLAEVAFLGGLVERVVH